MNNQHIVLEKRQTAAASIGLSSVWKVIKWGLTFCLALTLLIGCGGEPNLDNPKVREKILAKAIGPRNLENRSAPSGEEVIYAPNQEQPYTGWVKMIKGQGDDRFLIQFQNGKPNGLFIRWWKGKSNAMKGTLQNAHKVGVWTYWHKNGQKAAEGSYQNEQERIHIGEFLFFIVEFLHFLNDERYEHQFRHGKWVFWYENGQKEREGSYKNGERTGLWIEWDQDGEETGRRTYKN